MERAQFNPYTVQQLFPYTQQPEADDKKVKATTITNIKLQSLFNSNTSVDLGQAQDYAKSHYSRLSRKVEAHEIDHMLFSMYQRGISEIDLSKVAKCYGYQFQKTDTSGGSLISLKPL